MPQITLPPSWAPIEMKLLRLCQAAGLASHIRPTLNLFRHMVKHCRLREPRLPPRWSGLTDDSSPIEFSVVFRSHACQLRLLFEPQADPQTPLAYWNSARRITRYLAKRWGANIESACAIESLFRPRGRNVYLSGGHAVQSQPGRPPTCKVYYNAMAQGQENAHQVVGEALNVLGFAKAWKALERTLGPRDRVELLALDLTEQARVKLYVRPIGATLRHLQFLYSLAEQADPADVAQVWRRIHPKMSPEHARPTFLTFHLTQPGESRPDRAVVSVPLFPGSRSDLAAARRIRTLFDDYGVSPRSFMGCVKAMADGPLFEQQGIQSYVATHRSATDPAIVVYFNPRLYASRYGWLAREPTAVWRSPISPTSHANE